MDSFFGKPSIAFELGTNTNEFRFNQIGKAKWFWALAFASLALLPTFKGHSRSASALLAKVEMATEEVIKALLCTFAKIY